MSDAQHPQEDHEGTTNAHAGAVITTRSSDAALGDADDTGSTSDDEEDGTQEDEETDQAEQEIAADALPSPSNGGSAQALPWPEPLDNDSNILEVFDEREAPTKLDWPQLSGCPNAAVLAWIEQHRQVLVRVVTWNLQGKPPPKQSDIQAKLLAPNKVCW
jgi:hypothetical protein